MYSGTGIETVKCLLLKKLYYVYSRPSSADCNTTLQINAEFNELPVVLNLPPEGLFLTLKQEGRG